MSNLHVMLGSNLLFNNCWIMLYIYSSVIQTNTELMLRHTSFTMEQLPIHDITYIASGRMLQ